MLDDLEQFRAAMRAAGLQPPDVIHGDGKLRRFASNGKRGDNAGWYILRRDGIPTGTFGDWRTGVSQSWRANIGRSLTPAEETLHLVKVKAMARAREAEEVKRKAAARSKAAAIWKTAQPADDEHPYLARKNIQAHGVRLHKGALVIPLREGENLHSLQFINSDGHKRFLRGGRVAGCYFSIGTANEAKNGATFCIAEGFATGATIHQATSYPVAVAFNAGNLEAVARMLRRKFPEATLILCADDDVSTGGNPGLIKAKAAALAVSGKVAIPYFGDHRPDGVSDFNDMAAVLGPEAVAQTINSATRIDPAAADSQTIDCPRSEDVKGHSSGPYRIAGGRIVRERMTKDGPVVEPLCNFNAWVHEEVVLDDGAEATRAFQIKGELETGLTLPSVRIPASRFGYMNWVTESWGMRAIVRAGMSVKDALREAIQRLSPEPKLQRIFTHTGWREIDGEWAYLSGSSTGSCFEVDLGSELSRYKLPSFVVDPVSAMRASVKLLSLAPFRITAPLWAACYRAPLVSALPQDLSLWLEGKTGSMKSTLAAVFMCHYGDFDRLHLPGAWSSTANQLERRAFLLKDNIFVIDDYAPSTLDHRELETKAGRILRSQGNHSARGRLKADLSKRPAFPPRGIIVSTGEQHPPGQSLLARTLVIELDRDAVDLKLLTTAQQESARLSHAMAGYIQWLKPQMTDMPALLRETFSGARSKATTGTEHLRIPEAAAHLWLGLHSGLTYAEEIRAISTSEASELRRKCWDAFVQLGLEQAAIVKEEQPTRRFLGVLSTIITQGRAVMSAKDDMPAETKSGVDFIGWYDTEFLYLLPEATFSAVVRFCRDTGEQFPIRQERLKRDLAKEGISECEVGRLTATARIGGHTKRVLKLNIQTIETMLGITGVTGHHQYHRFENGERDAL